MIDRFWAWLHQKRLEPKPGTSSAIWEYLRGIGAHWWPWVVGVFAGGAGLLVNIVTDLSIPIAVWIGVPLVGLVLAQFLVYYDVWKEREALKVRNVTQADIDRLSELRSWGIHNILNSPTMTNDAEFDEWQVKYRGWRIEIAEEIEKRFTKSDSLWFAHIGLVQPMNIAVSKPYGGRHQKLLNLFAMQLQRLEEIIRKYSENLSA